MSSLTRQIRLILHAGTSKTGTSSLQFHMDRNRQTLKDAGILYPSEGTKEFRVPKHQWLVGVLQSANQSEMRRRLDRINAEVAPTTHTILLSTEGIFNHWWDFPDDGKELLRQVAQAFDTSVWIWFRDPVTFFASYYLQALRTPKISAIPAYGRDHGVRDLLRMPWITRHLQYQALLAEFGRICGEDSVYPFAHAKDLVAEVYDLFGIARPDVSAPRENVTSLASAGVEILRIVNRYLLDVSEKERAYELVEQLNTLIGHRDQPFTMSPDDEEYVRSLGDCTRETLDAMDRRSHERWAARFPSGHDAGE